MRAGPPTAHPSRWAWRGALCALGLFAAWRVVAIGEADRVARTDPDRALYWVAEHPLALLTLADRQLDAGQLDAAEATARRLLVAAPLEGRGFRVLADVALRRGHSGQAHALYRLATRRSPRDIASRAWLIEHALAQGRYGEALQHIDVVLRIAPGQHRVLVPLLVELSGDPAFASALADALATHPPWAGEAAAALAAATAPSVDARVLARRTAVAASMLRGLDRRDPIPAGR